MLLRIQMKRKIKVAYVGESFPRNFRYKFGGSMMTSMSIINAFNNDNEFEVTLFPRNTIGSIPPSFKGYDILHVDETRILDIFLKNKIQPDVIGPVTRSPVKNYKNWKCPYKPEQFYKSKIIRLNEAEERGSKYVNQIHYINHGVDTEYLKPSTQRKKYILWAGNKTRFAKNFDMFNDIMKITTLPEGYEFKVLSNYNLSDYYKILNETELLINTSRYESFCCAMFEAKSKGIPTIYKKGLHGDIVNKYCTIQVDYTPESYRDKILEVINKPALGVESRNYVLQHNTLKHMRDSIAKVYRL